mmetsp:Transcript_12359/g.32546  ORF Transcript_12359/g.32546 Transcript_12359/m.32546 type:complete len:249 (-) Transcript_12359:1248-1994(-)
MTGWTSSSSFFSSFSSENSSLTLTRRSGSAADRSKTPSRPCASTTAILEASQFTLSNQGAEWYLCTHFCLSVGSAYSCTSPFRLPTNKAFSDAVIDVIGSLIRSSSSRNSCKGTVEASSTSSTFSRPPASLRLINSFCIFCSRPLTDCWRANCHTYTYLSEATKQKCSVREQNFGSNGLERSSTTTPIASRNLIACVVFLDWMSTSSQMVTQWSPMALTCLNPFARFFTLSPVLKSQKTRAVPDLSGG